MPGNERMVSGNIGCKAQEEGCQTSGEEKRKNKEECNVQKQKDKILIDMGIEIEMVEGLEMGVQRRREGDK